MTRSSIAAFTALALGLAAAASASAETTVVRVSAHGMDLTRPRDAQMLLVHMQSAALEACGAGPGSSVAVRDATLRSDCYAQALSVAVVNVRSPALSAAFARTTAPASTYVVAR